MLVHEGHEAIALEIVEDQIRMASFNCRSRVSERLVVLEHNEYEPIEATQLLGEWKKNV